MESVEVEAAIRSWAGEGGVAEKGGEAGGKKNAARGGAAWIGRRGA